LAFRRKTSDSNANTLRPFRSGQNLSKVPEPGLFLPHAYDLTGIGWAEILAMGWCWRD